MLIECADCDAMFDPRPSGRGPSRQRCPEHVKQRKQDLVRARDMVNRAAGWGVETELVVAREVFERDGWICHLCGALIPETLRTARVTGGTHEPLSPVIDHVIPLSKGGPHTMDNCRAAHWDCNARKHNTEPGTRVPMEGEPTPPLVKRSGGVTGRRCDLDGCERQHFTGGLCQSHARRLREYGDPNKVRCGCGCGELITVAPSVARAMTYLDGHGLSGVVASPEVKLKESLVPQPVSERGKTFHALTDDCQVWTGPKNKQGYGRIYVWVSGQKRKGRTFLVHRLAYELANGEGSAHNLTIDHLCGVPLCCNPNHLEAVTIGENLRRAALVVLTCPGGHPYDEENTLYNLDGHRRCRQCNTDRNHVEIHGHEFVADTDNTSALRRRCLICRQRAESTPQFCPQGHEYTPENKRIDNQGKRYCQQCIWDRTHIPQFGHPFVPDPDGPAKKRRCLTCRELNPPPAHCINGHEFTDQTTEYTAKGWRNCVLCRLNADHVPKHGHEYVIDTSNPTTVRRCLVCYEAKKAVPQFCPAGHEFTAENTFLKNGWRNCRACGRNRGHRKHYGHDFVPDPDSGKRVSCRTCAGGRVVTSSATLVYPRPPHPQEAPP
ncbi:HNH endonuclease [Aldersonia sp. NBC_00410]|uniref:HNH endonuclease n=1 Tax=Aldersonia sp. NBC_00410 TaxID=2975954 RepID=UPI002252E963|nr:HNH endonuclease [Aldersonia sp. NBC_00410]MCX5044825.1 HNH endonuclease [Aldersonia sp. NBC_00410]MCX5046312.1 HNH endonuclease [Aldersonia sp. NBC_00410]